MFTYSFPIATIIFALSVPLSRSRSKPHSSAKAKRPVLLDRLEKYGNARKILSLSAQDHYVEVTTELGVELCLIRLNDAIIEAAPIEGFQIHRSHWVAKSVVKNLETKGSGGLVHLKGGETMNVSQSRLNDFRTYLG